MAHFPNPEFVKDKGCAQYLFFAKFIKVLNRNYIALSLDAHDQMIELVSDCLEAFHIADSGNELRKELVDDLRAEIQDLTGQTI